MSIVLYDYAQRAQPNRCWSYNVWKTRLVLNYKRIPYTTTWVDSNTLGPTLKSIGIPPNPDKSHFEYTVPAIKLLDGSVFTNSLIVASKLEALHPEPCLHLDSDLVAEAGELVTTTARPLFAIYMPRICRDVLEQSSVSAFVMRREKIFGTTFEEMENINGGERAWKAAEPGFIAMKRLLTSHKKDTGPFIYGSEVCYADFMLVALFESFKRVSYGMFERIISWDSCFDDLYKASQVWLENDQ